MSGRDRARSSYHCMLRRCYDPRDVAYSRYGGAGITVCERWREPSPNGFRNFVADMGDRPEGMSLDRRDGSKAYGPDNCQWATNVQQARNKNNNNKLTFGGKAQTVTEWALDRGLNRQTIYERIRMGWPIEKVLDPPRREKDTLGRWTVTR